MNDRGQYDLVVGNPPYITVKDKKLNEAYRGRYDSCHRKYALTAPFMERFFQLAKHPQGDQPAGWVGQITSNSFMKREFGSKLVENFLVDKDLRLIADTSGAYIPGHGTPTVIIVGKHQRPVGQELRAILGVRGEPGRPAIAADGEVWKSIVEHVGLSAYQDTWITVRDLRRDLLSTHPWSLSGGSATSLLQQVNGQSSRLGNLVDSIGFAAITGEDGVFVAGDVSPRRWLLDRVPTRPFVEGDAVRDFAIQSAAPAAFPYENGEPAQRLADSSSFWPYRTNLRSGLAFGKTREQIGKPWFEYFLPNWPRLRATRLLAFSGVATHNHFVLGRGGSVFNRWAPVIKLPAGATEDDHLGLLGVLNSSTACFWLKQNSHGKGNGGVNEGFRGDDWEEFFEFTGTTLKDFPLPDRLPLDRARALDGLAQALSAATPQHTAMIGTLTSETLSAARVRHQSIQGTMIAHQEELDWEVYRLYGLPGGDLLHEDVDLPELRLGERAFEIALARKVAAGEEETAWFVRHGSTPVTEIPSHWPSAYRDLVQRRLDLIESDPSVALLESPEHKRRWASESWESMEQRALRDWLLDRLENKRYWFSGPTPTPRSISQLADLVGRDEDLTSVLALWEGRPDVPIVQSLTKLLTDEAVPFLAAYRLKDSGLRKFEAWQETWEMQRQEDAGVDVGTIPVPPKYTNADFRRPSWWQARGKLDVPKERFILYPQAGRATDPTLLLGWAGWDHAEQSLALASIIGEREAEGRSDEDLVPLVAGLAELQPWVEQWHADLHPIYGQSLAVFCREQLADRCRQVNRSVEQLAGWRPPAATRGRKAKK